MLEGGIVGVGTMVTHGPLHRSGRAELPNPAPTMGGVVCIVRHRGSPTGLRRAGAPFRLRGRIDSPFPIPPKQPARAEFKLAALALSSQYAHQRRHAGVRGALLELFLVAENFKDIHVL